MLAAGCANAPPPTAQPNLTATYRMDSITARNNSLTIEFPVVTAPNADRLNESIQAWVGTRCPLPDTDGDISDVRTAQACLDAMTAVCRDQDDPNSDRNACLMHSHVEVATNAHDIVGLTFSGSIFMGGAHGTNYRIYRNLRLSDASDITAADLLKDPVSDTLRREIQARIRQQYQLSADTALTSAGFFEDRITPTDNVLIQPDGLRFTYQNYEIGPYVLGQPTAFLPYKIVAPLMRQTLAIMETGDGTSGQ